MSDFMKSFIGIALGGLILGLASQAGAAILITDNFSSLPSGGTLQTRTPDGTSFLNNVNSNGWTTNSILFSGNGSGGLSAGNSASRNALIDLGASYFVTNPGVYTLSVTLSTPTGQTGTSWVGLGFSPNNIENQSFNGLGAGPFLFQRNNGSVITFAGPDATNGSTPQTVTTGVAHTFLITLNTSGARWTVDATIDGTPIDLNGTGTAGDTFTYAAGANPVNTRYVGIAMAFNNDSSTTQTLDNFSFTGPVPVPEPTVASLVVAVSGLWMMHRRRA